MTGAAVIHAVDVDDLAVLEPGPWRDDLLAQRHAGARALTVFGRRDGDRVIVSAVLLHPDGRVRVTRTAVAASAGLHALTPTWPALHCFERELHEQTGVAIAGHPWLKPIRHEGDDQAAMGRYPYHVIEGKEVHEVAVGPIHAGVIEPGSFRFMCWGEQVRHLEIQLGYQHRGVERRLLAGDARRLAPLVETIAGDTSVAHAWAYGAAIERLAGAEVDPVAELARAIVLELERVAMHLAGLSGMAADVGFLQGATTYGRLRTTAINTTMRLCGSRFGRSAVRPGGVALRWSPELLGDVRAGVDLLRADLPIINACFLESHTVRDRLQRVGVLTGAQAEALGVVGLVARASGLAVDIRQVVAGGPYRRHPIALQMFDHGDCWARACVRVAELDTSLAWLASVLATEPRWGARPAAIGALAPRRLAVAVVEGWRGEVVHCLETDAAGLLAHYKVQDPSLRNWMGLAIAVRDNEISDFPICNKSFDLSYCGSDL
ncbi:MAG TPA: NADH-quinone oxidoreductase subunit C [Kofleriaceae bacterium]|nr:NADH-quinone oxidoreductase subunit C [Kofleriaceae bacterium]